jgi:hypothetical protein
MRRRQALDRPSLMPAPVNRVCLRLLAGALFVSLGCQQGSHDAPGDPSFEATSPEYEQRERPVTEDDLRILRQASDILHTESTWDREDDRVCHEEDTTWSLFCALQKASIEVLGEYQHRRVSLQEVRFAIVEASPGEQFQHRLRDFNNTRSFDEVKNVLAVAIQRVEARLANAGSSDFSR